MRTFTNTVFEDLFTFSLWSCLPCSFLVIYMFMCFCDQISKDAPVLNVVVFVFVDARVKTTTKVSKKGYTHHILHYATSYL